MMRVFSKTIALVVCAFFLLSCKSDSQLTEPNIEIPSSEAIDIRGSFDRTGPIPVRVDPYFYGMFACKESVKTPESMRRAYNTESNPYVVVAIEEFSQTGDEMQFEIMAVGYVIRKGIDIVLVPNNDATISEVHHWDVINEWYFCSITHPELVE